MPPVNTAAKQPQRAEAPPSAADEGKAPTPAEQALLQEKVQNAQKPPVEAESLLTAEAQRALGLTEAQKAKGEKYYIVMQSFELNWDNHRRIKFRQGGPFKLPVAIFEHWYVNPGNLVRVKEA